MPTADSSRALPDETPEFSQWPGLQAGRDQFGLLHSYLFFFFFPSKCKTTEFDLIFLMVQFTFTNPCTIINVLLFEFFS